MATKQNGNGKAKAKAHRTSWRDEKTVALLRLVIAGKLTTEEVGKKLGGVYPGFVRDQAYRLRRRLNLKTAKA